MRLIAVTRILKEDDIVEAFVRHHAGMVDHHLFLDNGSTDRTLDILRSLKAEGLKLTVLQNTAPFYAEVSYNTNLFKHARGMFSADWVLFLDADEFVDTRNVPNSLRHQLTVLPAEVRCLAVASVNYLDLPSDNSAEPIVPLRMRSRERAPPNPVAKMFVRGQLADAGATIEAGQHNVVLHGEFIAAYSEHKVTLAHYYRRSAWQIISKSVLGHLKVASAGKQERNKKRSSHYDDVFQSMRDGPERLLEAGFIHPTYEWLDLIDDPLPYLGGMLRYTEQADPKLKAIRVLVAYAEQLATQHGMLIDTNEGIRLQTMQGSLNWRHLF
jgi:glycosyltransferase involved in cell wall biosynthesis